MSDNFHIAMNEYLPLRDVVFQTLRNAILKGELQPGERLMEIQLAQRLGVSRTPVREAIRKLELEGLAIMIPRRGAIVADITVKDLEDVLEVRASLEELAARKACDYITEDQLRGLKKAAADFKKSVESERLLDCVEADMAFHEIIYAATGNKRLQQMLTNLREQMYRFRIEHLKEKNKRGQLVESHREILESLRRRDADAATRAIRSHIKAQEVIVMKKIEEF